MRVGQLVYIGWCPDDDIEGNTCAFESRCNTGEIHDGPFPPGHRFPAYPSHFIPETSYIVDVDDGGFSAVRQSLLFPHDLDPEVEIDSDISADILPPASAPVGVTGSLQSRSANHGAVRGPGARELHIDFDDFIEIAKGNQA